MPSEALRKKLKEEYRNRFPKEGELPGIKQESFFIIEENMPEMVFVINLDKSPDRWKKVKMQLDLAEINNVQRFSATDGYKIKITDSKTKEEFYGIDIKNKIRKLENGKQYKITCDSDSDSSTEFNFRHYEDGRGNGGSPGELGIWCSNVVLWKEVLSKGYRNVIIFEDDIIIKNPKTFKLNLSNYFTSLPYDYDLAYLSNMYKSFAKEYRINEYVNGFLKDSTGAGAHATIFSKQAIETLLSVDIYSYAIDVFFWCLTTGVINIQDQPGRCNSYVGLLDAYSSGVDILGVEEAGGRDSTISAMGRI